MHLLFHILVYFILSVLLCFSLSRLFDELFSSRFLDELFSSRFFDEYLVERDMINMVLACAKLFLDTEDEIMPRNLDVLSSPFCRQPSDKPVKFQMGIRPMKEMKTQVVCKTAQPVLLMFSQIIDSNGALSPFRDLIFQSVMQSAIQIFYSLARKVGSMSVCNVLVVLVPIF